MVNIAFDWPLLAVPLSLILLLPRILPFSSLRALSSPPLLLTFSLPLFMIHQFEEHGFDLTGTRYAFFQYSCRQLGFSPRKCPVSPAWIMAVNVGFVWTAGVVARMRLRNDVMPALLFNSWMLVNALTHVAAAGKDAAYNPGLGTAVTVLLPFSLYVYRVLLGGSFVSKGQVAGAVVLAIVQHALVIGNSVGMVKGLVQDRQSCMFWYVAGVAFPLAFGWMAAGSGPKMKNEKSK